MLIFYIKLIDANLSSKNAWFFFIFSNLFTCFFPKEKKEKEGSDLSCKPTIQRYFYLNSNIIKDLSLNFFEDKSIFGFFLSRNLIMFTKAYLNRYSILVYKYNNFFLYFLFFFNCEINYHYFEFFEFEDNMTFNFIYVVLTK